MKITALFALVAMTGHSQENNYTILFAPDGTIVARGLRGEDIERKLAEIFDKK